jgi:gliding motility-associated-like protein
MKLYTLIICCMPLLMYAQSLHLTNNNTWVDVGKIDVPGNQITVEALIYMTGSSLLTRNVVSKHTDPGNVNYLLRPKTFELTTYISGNSGPTQFLQMWNPYQLNMDRWYHIAGTYDGSTVKYYVDGCLIIEQPFSGNLFQNSLKTAIGNQSTCQCEQFIGNIDEVRIWNIARTQDQIQQHMLNLPNPASQQGLVSYFKFNNTLLNEIATTNWNGQAVGTTAFSNNEADIVPFALLSLDVTPAGCGPFNNGTATINTNRPSAQYALNNQPYQADNVFTNLIGGNYSLIARSPEGCLLDTTFIIEDLTSNIIENRSVSICDGQNYLGRTTSGIFIDTIPAFNGCDSIVTTQLTVLPNIQQTYNVTICQGETFEGYDITGTYIQSFVGSNGCDSVRTLHLEVFNSIDTVIAYSACQGDTYYGYSNTGTYVDVFTGSNGCDSTRTIVLAINPITVTTLQVVNCNREPYYFNDLSIAIPGIYRDTLVAVSGCDSIIVLELTDFELNRNFLGPDTISCYETELTVKSPSANTIWFDNTVDSQKTITKSGNYWAKIIYPNGCEVIDTIAVNFNTNIFMPNAFSPNDDGINDCIQPLFRSNDDITSYRYSIFDRWGSLVFNTEDIMRCWDGNQHEIGVYLFFIQFNTAHCGHQLISGDIQLLR